ncbi:MAG: translocase [Moraxellaceae bacterium]|nr:MAG: translocase [Moraxellaceae bacterium]
MPSLIQTVKNKLQSQGGFLKSVSVLAGGTAFAQALGVLVLPIITRLYSPAEFALFAVYASILGILAVAACLRFEIAIPLPEKNEDALSLFILAVLSNITITTLLIIVIFFFQDPILEVIQQPQLKPFIWFIPIGVFFAGLYNALQYWTTRQKQFSTIAKTRMTQSVASSSVQIGGGYLGLGSVGLIVGQVISFSAGILRLFISFWKESKPLYKLISITRVKENGKKYDKFPKYSTFESLANVAAIQLPVIIIAAVAIGPEAGYLMLAMKVMAIPMGLIGGSIAQVYLSRAPLELRNGSLKLFSSQILAGLFKAGVGPLICVGLLAPYVFSIIFGQEWGKAGEIILWMTPWFIFQFLASPISMIMHIKGLQAEMLLLTVSGFFLRVGAVLIAGSFAKEYVAEVYAISGGLFYLICYIVFYNNAGLNIKDHFKCLSSSVLFLIFWIILGSFLKIIFEILI